MGKLSKFFGKFSSDKFQKEGPGRRLDEDKFQNKSKQVRSYSPPSASPGPPSQGAIKAADAALSRIAAKQIPSKTPIQRKVEAEKAQLKKQVEQSETLSSQLSKTAVSSDNGGALIKVTFSCPNLLGDDVSGTYVEIDQLIEQALLEESKHDPSSAYALLIIRAIESSQYPAGVDPSDASTPSIQIIRDKRRQNLITIIGNLIENPAKENFRRLRMGNKLIADLLELKFAIMFFETCGFAQRDQPVSSDENSTMEKCLVFPTAPTEEQLHHLTVMLNLLKSGDLILPKLNRDTTVLQAGGNMARDMTREMLPAEFFLVSRDDMRRRYEELDRIEDEKVLLTKAMRERFKGRDRRLYRYALIRVRLPNSDLLIQGTFIATETVSDVRCWISDCLVDKSLEYSLWAPPGQLPSVSGRPATAKVLLDDCEPTASIVDLGLAPSAILTLTTNSMAAKGTIIQLLPELEQQASPLEQL